MNTVRAFVAMAVVWLCFVPNAGAQYTFKLVFRGTVYQTNGLGKVVGTPITERTLVEAAAAAGGLDPQPLVLAYHISGSAYGDTIELVNATTHQNHGPLFGLFFGDDSAMPSQPVGRTALTNSPATEERRIDYVYMFQSSAYTSWNSHSMGATFTTKRHQTDSLGNRRTIVEARIHWIVNPSGNGGTKVIEGNFTTTRVLY